MKLERQIRATVKVVEDRLKELVEENKPFDIHIQCTRPGRVRTTVYRGADPEDLEAVMLEEEIMMKPLAK